MNLFVKNCISKFISAVSTLTPQKKVICFDSYPDYTDNPYAAFIRIINDARFKNYRIVWMIGNKNEYTKLRKKIIKDYPPAKVVKKRSLKGLYYLLVCRFYLCSHGVSHTVKLNQKKPKIINLWHGMPLKVVGIMDKAYGNTFENSDIIIATNDFFADILSRCFLIDRANVKVFGQARNDTFKEPTDFFDLYNVSPSRYAAIGVWMPTFKKNIYTEKRIDGFYKEGYVSFFSPEMLSTFDKDLAKRNILIIVKLHPMDAMNQFKFPLYTNILIVNDSGPRFQLYPMLGKMDFLLTDYSSVFVDYDILGRPMGFTINDLESYKQSRGFFVDDVESFLPGVIISDYTAMIHFIDNYKEMQKETGDTFNKYKDFNSAQRLLNYLSSVS